jgi:hypothetical protein
VYQFVAALSYTFNYRLFPLYYQVKFKNVPHFFEKTALFSRDHFKECINLNRTTVIDNKLNITLYERFAKNIQYLRLERLPLCEDTIDKFRASKSGHISFENVYLHALPDFTMVKVIKISKNLDKLSLGTETREGLCEYWSQIHRIKLPANVRDPDSKTIFFCLTDSGIIYPSCCLLHDVMVPAKYESPGALATKFLANAKEVLEKMELFENDVCFTNATPLNVQSLQLNGKNLLTLGEKSLKRLNRKVNEPEISLKSVSSTVSMSASKPKQRKLRTSPTEDKENASARKPVKRKQISTNNSEEEEEVLPPPPTKKKPSPAKTIRDLSNESKSLSSKSSSRLLRELNTVATVSLIDDDDLPIL